MSIKRFVEKPTTFDFQGITIGLRMPTVAEMTDITKKRALMLKSMGKDGRSTDSVDLELIPPIVFYVAKTLCCDPEDASEPWFAVSEQQQKQLADRGINKDLAEEAPYPLLLAAHNAFNETYAKEAEERESTNPTSSKRSAKTPRGKALETAEPQESTT